jgi:hypothetical protein
MSRTKHKGNGHDPRHVTETPDVSHIKNPDVTHEASDVSVSGVGKFVVALTILCIAVFVLVWVMFRFLDRQEETKDVPGPMAMSANDRLPPPPRLQAARGFGVTLENGEVVNLETREPEAEYRALREQWERRLKCQADDKEDHELATSGTPTHDQQPAAADTRKVICISIEDAMQKLVASGPPSRVKTIPEEGPGSRAEDYGVDSPTDASSGRVSGKGKQ